VTPSKSKPPAEGGLGTLIARYFAERGWGEREYNSVSKSAGLDDQWVKRTVQRRGPTGNAKRGSLLKLAAALDLSHEKRVELASAAGLPEDSLRLTMAEKIVEPSISMRRAVILLTAPTDPHLSPFRVKLPGVAIRTGVVFGWHDVVTRVTTPDDVSVLDYADRLFKGGKLRTVETIPLRDDLPTYVDREFDKEGLDAGDYFWAVIFVQALGTPKKPEFRDIFLDVSRRSDFKGSIHLLTAGVAVGQFDTVIEVLAANLSRLQKYVRDSQMLAQEKHREVHTVTYFAPRWTQQPPNGEF
jgi:hypothetical protein